jgi:recombination associated protein RdgC
MGSHLICLKVETRSVPANTIKEMVEEKIAQLKAQDPDAKITGALKKTLKEEIKNELLPRAFSKYERIYAYWDSKLSYLVINLASRTKAETFAAALKNAMPELTISALPVQSIHEPTVSMTNWLTTGQHPAELELLEAVTIRDVDEEDNKGSIKYANQDLNDDRLKGYLGETKTVSELEVRYDNKTSFILTEDLLIKSVKWSDEIKEEADNSGDDDSDSYLLSAFTVMQAEVKVLVKYLLDDCFGGEQLEIEE